MYVHLNNKILKKHLNFISTKPKGTKTKKYLLKFHRLFVEIC